MRGVDGISKVSRFFLLGCPDSMFLFYIPWFGNCIMPIFIFAYYFFVNVMGLFNIRAALAGLVLLMVVYLPESAQLMQTVTGLINKIGEKQNRVAI